MGNTFLLSQVWSGHKYFDEMAEIAVHIPFEHLAIFFRGILWAYLSYHWNGRSKRRHQLRQQASQGVSQKNKALYCEERPDNLRTSYSYTWTIPKAVTDEKHQAFAKLSIAGTYLDLRPPRHSFAQTIPDRSSKHQETH